MTSDNELPKDVRDLKEAIEKVPAPWRGELDRLMHQVAESSLRRKRILSLVQEALSQLRLDLMYLTFDLEATRRERDALRHGD